MDTCACGVHPQWIQEFISYRSRIFVEMWLFPRRGQEAPFRRWSIVQECWSMEDESTASFAMLLKASSSEVIQGKETHPKSRGNPEMWPVNSRNMMSGFPYGLMTETFGKNFFTGSSKDSIPHSWRSRAPRRVKLLVMDPTRKGVFIRPDCTLFDPYVGSECDGVSFVLTLCHNSRNCLMQLCKEICRAVVLHRSYDIWRQESGGTLQSCWRSSQPQAEAQYEQKNCKIAYTCHCSIPPLRQSKTLVNLLNPVLGRRNGHMQIARLHRRNSIYVLMSPHPALLLSRVFLRPCELISEEVMLQKQGWRGA